MFILRENDWKFRLLVRQVLFKNGVGRKAVFPKYFCLDRSVSLSLGASALCLHDKCVLKQAAGAGVSSGVSITEYHLLNCYTQLTGKL